jgi:hypothetical protein
MRNKNLKGIFFGLVLFVCNSINSQIHSKHVLGVRFSDLEPSNLEVSWQKKLSERNRSEFGLVITDNFSLSGMYQWVWVIQNRFNWYTGVGSILDKRSRSGYVLSAAGSLGIEYNFKVPLQITLGIRPSFGVLGDFLDFDDAPMALGLRYRF